MDNIKTWTGLHVEELIRMTEDRDKWRKYVHGVVNPRIEAAEEQNIDRHLDIRDDHMERLPTILTRWYRPNFPQAYASDLCRHCCGHIVSCRLQIIIITTDGRRTNFPSIFQSRVPVYLLPPVRGAAYCDERVCLCVCLSLCHQQ